MNHLTPPRRRHPWILSHPMIGVGATLTTPVLSCSQLHPPDKTNQTLGMKQHWVFLYQLFDPPRSIRYTTAGRNIIIFCSRASLREKCSCWSSKSKSADWWWMTSWWLTCSADINNFIGSRNGHNLTQLPAAGTSSIDQILTNKMFFLNSLGELKSLPWNNKRHNTIMSHIGHNNIQLSVGKPSRKQEPKTANVPFFLQFNTSSKSNVSFNTL